MSQLTDPIHAGKNPVWKLMRATVSVIRWLILALWLYISDLPPLCCSLILLSLKTPLTFPKVLLSSPALITEAGFKRN